MYCATLPSYDGMKKDREGRDAVCVSGDDPGNNSLLDTIIKNQ